MLITTNKTMENDLNDLKDFKSYTQPEYINTVNKIFSKLKDYAKPNYNGTNSMCLTYDNYFKLRD